MINAQILKCRYTAKEAITLLLHTDAALDIQDIEEVYYPYVRLRYELKIGKGKRIRQVLKYCDCIVERVSGTVYEASGSPELEEIRLPKDCTIDIEVSMEQCYAVGHDFALKQFLQKARLLFTPKMKILEEDHFYKRFYIVACLDENGEIYYIMVDGVDGGISILDHEKYNQEQPLVEHA